ncbi:organic hydroperoxide resistance protein [Shewanella mangrovi]|uniref:Organic hydroperoxide resistance protein n=1 Tax=Shewanella mangrovi TaxID=1515746 RepID=A0A094JHE7_9GAMM|nr:organic hydroperoxide resistance protein [Shewanella mangrovi]KFZ37459.1 organic hydroperoxide resistance protein [Shewanella mangrovi]
MLYQTSATASAGRQGHAETDDKLLSVDLAYPKQMGGNGAATNPEQLFAAGYAACFSNAILFLASQQKIKLAKAPVTATIGLFNKEDGGFALSAALAVELNLPTEQAQQLVRSAHQICPYSNAVKGNIDVVLSVNGNPL